MLAYKLFDATDYPWWKSFDTVFSWKLSTKSWLWWQGDLFQKKVYKIFKRSYEYLNWDWKKQRRVFRVSYGWQGGPWKKEIYEVFLKKKKTRVFLNKKMQQQLEKAEPKWRQCRKNKGTFLIFWEQWQRRESHKKTQPPPF